MQKILYLDMDGVVADFDKLMCQLLPHIELGDGDPNTYTKRSAAVDEAALKYPTLFEDLESIEGAPEAVEELKLLYDIYFLSTPMCKVFESYTGKRKWIHKMFGEWADKRLILTHRKDLCIGDFLVDDRLKNGSESFKGCHIHFGTEKFPDWETVIDFLRDKA